MFGSNELIGTSRTAIVNRIYDFEGKVRMALPNNDTEPKNDDNAIRQRTMKRYEYFRDCVLQPVSRSIKNGGDFRAIKKDIFEKVNAYIINIERCLKRFNTAILFDTASDISADRSRSLTMAGMEKDKLMTSSPTERGATVAYVSLINGEDGNEKMKNIIGLDKGGSDVADNLNMNDYSKLLQFTSEEYKTDIKKKELYLAVYGKVFRYRKRIDEILSMMFEQSKNDVSAMNTIRISEPVIKELRMILGYLAIIKCTQEIIEKEQSKDITIYNRFDSTTMSSRQLSAFEATASEDLVKFLKDKDSKNNIQNNNILKLPHDDDSYNNTDEKRYLYGITYYFGGRPHGSPPPPPS